MPDRNIPPPIFTQQLRGAIKLRADYETRAYIEALEAIAHAANQLVQANDELTRGRVRMQQRLMQVNFMG